MLALGFQGGTAWSPAMWRLECRVVSWPWKWALVLLLLMVPPGVGAELWVLAKPGDAEVEPVEASAEDWQGSRSDCRLLLPMLDYDDHEGQSRQIACV